MSERCPKCDADLNGGEIPENIRRHYSPPYRWSRKIRIYSYEADATIGYQCPDCSAIWPARSADAVQSLKTAE